MQAEIIANGDEITSGRILDTNGQWLSQRLEDLGIRVLYHTAVGDDLEAMVAVFRLAVQRADVIVVTGGLGPTADDLTREALARAAQRQLLLDPVALEHVRSIFARRKRPMPAQNELQGYMPEGSRIIHNPNGTAPGIALDVPRDARPDCRFYCLPGVPAEMKEMWPQVDQSLREAGAGRQIIVHRAIKCFGAGESQVEAMLPDLIRRGRSPRVGITASQTTIILRVTAEANTREECLKAMEPTVSTIRDCLGALVFGEADDELQDVVVRVLRERRQTLATAEAGTAGMLADALAVADPSGDCFRGGVTAVSGPAAVRLLDVSPALLDQHGLRSSLAAEAMAVGCRKRLQTDWGLAISPFPSVNLPEPQPVFLALATPNGVTVKPLPFASHPATARIYCLKQALNLLRLALV